MQNGQILLASVGDMKGLKPRGTIYLPCALQLADSWNVSVGLKIDDTVRT